MLKPILIGAIALTTYPPAHATAATVVKQAQSGKPTSAPKNIRAKLNI